jgi:hypothetical protein
VDITNQVIQAINGWLQSLAAGTLQPALRAAGQLLFQTPQYDGIPEIEKAWTTVRNITDAVFILAVLGAGLLVMVSGTFETEYTAKRLLPRLALAAVLGNASLAITGILIRLENAVVTALLGGDPSTTVWSQVTAGLAAPNPSQQVVSSLIALAAAVLAVLLIVVYIARDLILLVATVMAPLALAAYSLPQTEEIARLWWRIYAAALFVQVAQAVLISIGVQLLHHTDWLGTPASDLVNGLVLVTLLYLILKLPFAAYRWACRQPVGQNRLVKTVVIAAKAAAAAAA